MISSRSAAQMPLVLVVDDLQSNLRLMGEVLGAAGFDVMPALSGEQALLRVRAQPPDAILLDMRMPGMDGFGVLERLKHDPELADIPVLFVTAEHDRECVVQALEAGAADYLTKPFVAEELVARVRAHAEARQLRQRLRRAVREREEISSMVAHDLKNPLFSIALKAGVLREQAHDPERVRELAARIEQSAQRTMAFISNYLEQRADVELRRDYQPAVCDGDLLLQVLQREFDSVLAHKRQRLLRDVQQIEPVLADVEAFGVVMRNLLSNASKYSPAGSAITLACRRGKPGHLQFAVVDEGPGIAIEERPRLFQRFVRLSSQPTGDESSSGLGLSAALTEARWMGGELWYEEAPGGGACFVLELPLAPVV